MLKHCFASPTLYYVLKVKFEITIGSQSFTLKKGTTMISNIKTLVTAYFRGVDNEDINTVLNTLHIDCKFSIETHGIKLQGHNQISKMLHYLWKNHQWVRHDHFFYIEDASALEIAVRFKVTNKLHNNALVFKSNCNFFTLKENKFSNIRVYMAGENTLTLNQAVS